MRSFLMLLRKCGTDTGTSMHMILRKLRCLEKPPKQLKNSKFGLVRVNLAQAKNHLSQVRLEIQSNPIDRNVYVHEQKALQDIHMCQPGWKGSILKKPKMIG